jgi:hypothetical protein
MNARLLLLLAVTALAVGACGKRSSTLDRPPPLFGHKDGGEPVAVHKDPPAPPETQDDTIRKAPLDTGKSDPIGQPGDFFPR